MNEKIYRNRLTVILTDYCKANHINRFKPNRSFFQLVKIGQKRFWQLVRNEAELTFGEMNRLAEFFDVPLDGLHVITVVESVTHIPAVNVPNFEYMNQGEVMKLLNIGKTKLWELRRDEKLPEHKVGRKSYFHRQDVIGLIANGKQS